MSKRIVYRRNKTNEVPAADRAAIVPNAAPVVAKPATMSAGAKICTILLIVIAILAIALLAINIVSNKLMSKINTTTPWYEESIVLSNPADMGVYENEKLLASEGYAAAYKEILANYAEASHSVVAKEGIYNFAIYGINTFDSNTKGTSALVMLASFNAETNKVTYISLEESALVYIPVVAKIGELRDAYEWGGAALLSKTIQYNFGVSINGYVEINLAVASELIDNAGGIEVSISDENAVNGAIKSFNELFNKQVANVTVANGKATLTGEQALAYSRMGSDEMNVVVKTLGTAIFQSGIGGMVDSFNIITDNANTAINSDDFAAIAKMAVTSLKKADTKTVTVGTVESVWHFEFKVEAYTDYAAVTAAIKAAIN